MDGEMKPFACVCCLKCAFKRCTVSHLSALVNVRWLTTRRDHNTSFKPQCIFPKKIMLVLLCFLLECMCVCISFPYPISYCRSGSCMQCAIFIKRHSLWMHVSIHQMALLWHIIYPECLNFEPRAAADKTNRNIFLWCLNTDTFIIKQ